MSQQINLFNPIFLKQKKYFSALTMVQALGLILAGSMAFYSFASYRTDLLAKQGVELDKRLAAEEARFASASARLVGRKKDKQLESEIAALQDQVHVRQEVMAVLQNEKLGNTNGFSEYMRAFSRQIVNGLWLTGFSIEANDMTLSGRTLRPELVPVYIRRLSQEAVMQGKAFAVMEMHQPSVATDKSADEKSKVSESAAYLEFNLRSSEAEGGK